MSLDTLATEIQCSIIRLLDPHGLISISQTNTHFRRLVDPKEKHFVDRLLYLETLVEYGGVTPIFRSRDNHIDPAWTDERWEAMRWACVGCNRLRSFKHFENSQIMRLHFRKPLPASLPASQFTTWEPLDEKPVFKPKTNRSREEVKRQRRRYFTSITRGRADMAWFRDANESWLNHPQYLRQHLGMVGFEPYDDGVQWHDNVPREKGLILLDENAVMIELERCGTKRRLRRCNKCRYQGGQLRPRANGHGGTVALPILASRQISFGSQVDRYFPGFSEYLDSKRPSFDPPSPSKARTSSGASLRGQLWTMWTVRCPGCTRWQELREFRCGGLFRHWKPNMRNPMKAEPPASNWDGADITQPLLDALRCNRCFAEANSRLELAQALLTWIKRVIENEIRTIYWQLRFDYFHLKDSPIWQTLPRPCKLELKRVIESKEVGWEAKVSRLESDGDVAILKHRRRQWRDEFWAQVKKTCHVEDCQQVDLWFDHWISDFDDNEAHRAWLKSCVEELEQKPEVLADWALGRDGTAFT